MSALHCPGPLFRAQRGHVRLDLTGLTRSYSRLLRSKKSITLREKLPIDVCGFGGGSDVPDAGFRSGAGGTAKSVAAASIGSSSRSAEGKEKALLAPGPAA